MRQQENNKSKDLLADQGHKAIVEKVDLLFSKCFIQSTNSMCVHILTLFK